MKDKLLGELPKSLKTSTGKWLYISPDLGDGYGLYDPIAEKKMGRILFDESDHWIYDGELLTIDEQEEVAGAIHGHQKEMDELINSLKNELPWQISN
jgi:hypothetical protein